MLFLGTFRENGCFPCMNSAGRKSTEAQKLYIVVFKAGHWGLGLCRITVSYLGKDPKLDNTVVVLGLCVGAAWEVNPAGRRGCVWRGSSAWIRAVALLSQNLG